ncbi:MAG: glycosyltransferase family 9 protein [Candidatus Eremiobacteraeota bacterium]|nr:glycosyltransferase family 9 protein [Candidatus Eremiobacteraeota bacterium]
MTVMMLRALGLGDFLTAVPVYRAFARAFRGARVVVAAPHHFDGLAELIGGIEIADARPLEPLNDALGGADVAVNLHGRGPQSHRILLATHPRRFLAFRNAAVPESADGPVHDDDEHEVSRWCRLARHYGVDADPDDLDLRLPPVVVPKRLRGATIVHVGAGAPARCWPVERWSVVVRGLLAAGERVVVTSGADEAALAHDLAEQSRLPVTHVLAGRTTLRELAALVAWSHRVLCTDTGMAHLATAYRIPSVVLFGPTAPSRWGPPRGRPWHRVLWAGRTGDPNGRDVDPGLLEITPERVLSAVYG